MKYNICCVIGTRPEALKMAPVIKALSKYNVFSINTLLTAQHREMADQALSLLEISVDHDLNIMKNDQKLGDLTARLLHGMSDYLHKTSPDMIIAQGDTTTVLVSALLCFYNHIPFAYVESGLRSGNFHRPFPEEMNRQFASKIAALNFAPTTVAKENLLAENVNPETIFVTGNTIIDTLLELSEKIPTTELEKRRILVTCHRRENFGQNLINICSALKSIARSFPDIEIIYPVHPNPNVKIPVYEALGMISNVKLIEPVDYFALIELMKSSYLILTDSGGIQEEAPSLNKPVLVMRTETERPEGISAGVAKLVGVVSNHIVNTTSQLLSDPQEYSKMINKPSPYGDGMASERIVQHICEYFKKNKA